jgi:acyl-CoA hydrolase/RimJ/RimL family protein N-acetyltransferase
MGSASNIRWKDRLVPPDVVIDRVRSGMAIFLGTGAAEPATLIRHLLDSKNIDFKDLDLIQLVSIGEAIAPENLTSRKYRLRTCYSGSPADRLIRSGQVDFIPTRFSRIADLIRTRRISIDAAFFQVSLPDESGFCSLGPAVDVAREVMDQADWVAAEVNSHVPFTFGDTLIPVSDFDFLIQSDIPPTCIERPPIEETIERVASGAASLIEDGSCIAFSVGPIYEALGRRLSRRKNLGIHSPLFTDALMDLVESGAANNRVKEVHRGKSVASYAIGTPDLMKWLHRNPRVEFHGAAAMFDPAEMGKIRGFAAVLPATGVDLSGRVVLAPNPFKFSIGAEHAADILLGTELSEGGKAIFALPSRDPSGRSNIRVSVEKNPDLFALRDAADLVVTEYGTASLAGRSIRERAQALIDIAHPGDRLNLLQRAKEEKILFPDQIFIAECAWRYPSEIETQKSFSGDLNVRFRAIRPSDEEEMRRLFYRISDEAVFHRYFSPINSMPHAKVQEYVNADCNAVVSIVGEIEHPEPHRIIAEGRFVRLEDRPYAELAFVVEESFQGRGIATFVYGMLAKLAKERGLKGFTAEVMPSNRAMMRVFEKGRHPISVKPIDGIYQVMIPLE